MGQGKPSRILVVDDRPQNVELLKAHLTKAGYIVDAAGGGQEALDKVAAQMPDLVLLDIVMPDVDGFSVCARLKGNTQTNFVPVVVVTALKETTDKIRALEVGADDFLSKPFDLYELLARVRSLLRIKALHDELERNNQLLQQILNRYMAEDLATLMLEDPDRYLKLGGENRVVSVLFADIRGFTRFSARHSAGEVVDVLNLVFTELTKTVFEYRGTFDKYLGDAIMAFFGAPISYDDDALRAVRTAMRMQRVFQGIIKQSDRDGLHDLGLGIGINTGEAIVGNIGSDRIMDYTVIGDTANVARRLQEIAGKGQIMIGESTFELVKDYVVAQKAVQQAIRGREDPIVYYELKQLMLEE
jgi:class 3 adenylate cyclase